MNMRTVFTKKAAFLLTFLLIAAMAVPGTLLAADNLLLSVSDAGGDTGDLVEVNISIENASGSEGGQFVLNFDGEMLKPIALETDVFLEEASNSMEMANLDYDQGQLMFIWVTAAADTEDSGVLCTVTFEVLKEGESLLEIDEVVISPDGIDSVVEPGLVTAPAEEANGITDTEDAADIDVAVEEGRTSPLVIILAVAALVIAGYAAYRLIKKPGAGQK